MLRVEGKDKTEHQALDSFMLPSSRLNILGNLLVRTQSWVDLSRDITSCISWVGGGLLAQQKRKRKTAADLKMGT